MAEIPKSSRRVLSSGRVAGGGVSIPSDIADTGQGLEARALGDLGQGIGLLGNVLAEIEIRDRENDDSLASLEASKQRQGAANQWNQFKIDNAGRPEIWEQGGQTILDSANQGISKLTYHSEQNSLKANIEQEAWKDNFFASTKLQATSKKQEKAKLLAVTNFTNAFASQSSDLLLAEDKLDQVLANELQDPKLIAIEKASILSNATKQRVAVQSREGDFEGARETANSIVGIEETERNALLRNIDSAEKAQKARNRLVIDEQQESARNAINNTIYIDKDYTRALAEVDASPLDETEQRALFKEIDSRATKAARGEPETNDSVALDNVTTAIAQVGNNTLPLADGKDIYNKNKAKLKSETADTLLKELNKSFDASVDSASARVRTDVRLRAVGKTESALDRLLEALVGVKPDDEEALQERITTAREKFTLELDNFNRWEESQRKWRQTNNTASPDEILREGMRAWFTEFAGKDITQLRAESEESVKAFEFTPMETPDGERRGVPANRVKDAIQAGWKKL